MIVGIDPSLTGTGIAFGNRLMTVGSKPAGTSLTARRERLTDLCRRIVETAGPGTVIIEAPSLGQARQGGTLDRNGLWWLLVDELMGRGAVVVEVPPATLKKFATGRGNAPKGDMRMALFKRAGIDCGDDNQVDAWWLRQIGLHLTDDPDRLRLPQPQLAALDKIDRPAVAR